MQISRDILAKVRVHDWKKILDDFNKVYTPKTKPAALSELTIFKENWEKYSIVIKLLEENSYLLTMASKKNTSFYPYN